MSTVSPKTEKNNFENYMTVAFLYSIACYFHNFYGFKNGTYFRGFNFHFQQMNKKFKPLDSMIEIEINRFKVKITEKSTQAIKSHRA